MIAEYEATVLAFLGAAPIEAAKADAIAKFPNESCGFISNGIYIACENTNATPATLFTISDPRYEAAVIAGTIQAIIHSHPNGPLLPSELDMAQQIASNVPWVVITLNQTGIYKMIAWGGNLPIAPVIARPFIHGIFDCYSLIRDVFRQGSVALAAQGVSWPLPPIALPEVARANNWWATDTDDLYSAHLSAAGFKQITRGEAQPGDGFLIALGDSRQNPKKRLCHAGVLLGHDQILHHMPTRLSARSPAGIWAKVAGMWVRYSPPAAPGSVPAA